MPAPPDSRQRSRQDPEPYYVVPGDPLPRRILLISYHAPPSNEVGALRWAGMARHLASAGWGLDIIALDPAALATQSPESLRSLPPGTRLFGVPDPTPPLDRLVRQLVRLRNRLRAPARREAAPRGAVLSSEARQGGISARTLLNAFHAWREYARGFGWARRAAAVGIRIHEPGVHQWVACSSPPHMAHEAARRIARRTGIPCLADFRDPWRFSEWVSLGPAWLWLARRHEPRIIRESALTAVNVEPLRPILQRAYPNSRIVTVTNGVDDPPVAAPAMHRRFVIGYPGGIYLGRDPAVLFAAAGRLVQALQLTPEQLSLEFMGFFDPPIRARLEGLAAEAGIGGHLRIHPGASRAKALEFMASCAVLVALQQGSDLAIPAKIFEYMRFPAWLLVIAGRTGATARLVEGTTAVIHEPGDEAGLRDSLAELYRRFRDSGRPQPLAADARFGREAQTRRLLRAMEQARPAVRASRLKGDDGL